MAEIINVLDEYLRLTLVPAEGDEELAKLEAIGSAVKESLKSNPARVVRYALVGMDPAISSSDPTIIEVDQIIQTNWRSFNNRYRHKAINIARATIADALYSLGKDDPLIASSVALTTQSFLPFSNLGAEGPIWSTIAHALATRSSEAAEPSWYIGKNEKKLLYTTVSADALAETFRAGFGAQTSSDGTAIVGTNTLNVNNAPAWAENAAKMLGKSVADQISSTSKMNADNVFSFIAARTASLEGLAHRIDLLWWKESLFSPALDDGYRAVTPTLGALAMAADLSARLPFYAPRSVEWILREAILSAFGEKGKKQPLNTVLKAAIDSKHSPTLAEKWPKREDVKGRRSFAQFVGEMLHDLNGIAHLEEAVGIAPSVEMSISDVAVLAFQGLQASKIVAP